MTLETHTITLPNGQLRVVHIELADSLTLEQKVDDRKRQLEAAAAQLGGVPVAPVEKHP